MVPLVVMVVVALSILFPATAHCTPPLSACAQLEDAANAVLRAKREAEAAAAVAAAEAAAAAARKAAAEAEAKAVAELAAVERMYAQIR